MESIKINTGKKNFLAKTWKHCQSFPISRSSSVGGLRKSKSWSGEETRRKKKTKKKVTPEGYFPVCVGPEKQRFAVKTKYVNHPMFSTLLDDAETEFGYKCDGPIMLACDVDLFYKVLAEMEAKDVRPLDGALRMDHAVRLVGVLDCLFETPFNFLRDGKLKGAKKVFEWM